MSRASISLKRVSIAVVKRVVGNIDNYWLAFQTALNDDDLRNQIERTTSRAPAGLSLLRRADVVIWMQGNADA